jgi:hypothetical protein
MRSILRGFRSRYQKLFVLSPHQTEQAAEKAPTFFVIPSEARNLSFFLWGEIEERFLASLGMTK